VASKPGGNGSTAQAHGPRRTPSSPPRCRRCLIGTAAFTAHHASIRNSGPRASRWDATALPGSCAVQTSRPRPDGGSGLAATAPARPPKSRRICCSRSSAQQRPTAAGPVTSLTSAPQKVGGIWPCRTNRCAQPTGSTCTAAAWSAAPWAPPWRPPWCWKPSTGPWGTARSNPINF